MLLVKYTEALAEFHAEFKICSSMHGTCIRGCIPMPYDALFMSCLNLGLICLSPLAYIHSSTMLVGFVCQNPEGPQSLTKQASHLHTNEVKQGSTHYFWRLEMGQNPRAIPPPAYGGFHPQ